MEFLDEPSPKLSRRYLRLIFDGMRREGARPLGVPSPTLLR
nr:hypothetical protein [Hyalangium versicolor]